MSETMHTPGPWRWEVNLHSKRVQLCGGKNPFDLTVMDFVRWGMGNAAPRFMSMTDGHHMLLDRCEKFAEIVPGREHHARWFQALNHPDARLIAAAPDLLEALRKCRSALDGLMGDSDLPADDSPEMEAMQAASAAIAKATGAKP